MAVVPLTLTISLCLAFTFIVFFVREQRFRRFASNDSESLLPLAEETARATVSAQRPPCRETASCACTTCPRHSASPSAIA